jgi:hypothetical protein
MGCQSPKPVECPERDYLLVSPAELNRSAPFVCLLRFRGSELALCYRYTKGTWLRGWDLNPRSSAHEADEMTTSLPHCCLAASVGIEPTTIRLTVGRSTSELQSNASCGTLNENRPPEK